MNDDLLSLASAILNAPCDEIKLSEHVLKSVNFEVDIALDILRLSYTVELFNCNRTTTTVDCRSCIHTTMSA